jgi:hypothetical protein
LKETEVPKRRINSHEPYRSPVTMAKPGLRQEMLYLENGTLYLI